jgi:hypothetical protein
LKNHAKYIAENLTTKDYLGMSLDFLVKITNESERGAVLIGGNEIDERLEKLITEILPNKSKSYKSRLLNYPGPLSSFSGKIELLYAFRIFDKRLYESLNTLRKIRNDAAHSSKLFSIQSIKEKLDSIYNFEEGFSDVAHKMAFDFLIKHKKENLKTSIENSEFSKDLDYEKLWNEKVPNPENVPIIMEHLTIWKFAIGLVFICLKIEAIIDDYSSISETDKIWIE